MSTSRASALAFVVAVASATPAPVDAQATPATLTPAGWSWRTDVPATPRRGAGAGTDSTFEFSPMAPGWHVTMGPGGVLYADQMQAEGRFVLEAELILFPDASEAEYGVFVGGSALSGSAGGWTAFVVRADGSAAVLRHEGAASTPLLAWAPHAAVKVRASGATARNVVSVRAEPDSVRFLVNGERVAAWPRATIAVDGAFGLRVGRGVNLHVTNLDVTRRMAPYPRR